MNSFQGNNEDLSHITESAVHDQGTDETVGDVSNIHVEVEVLKDKSNTEITKRCIQFWCQRCGEVRDAACPVHGDPCLVEDSPILPKSMASVPWGLLVTDIPGTDRKGVKTNRVIYANSIFGPFDAEEIEQKPSGFTLMIEKDGKLMYLRYEDEHVCNWLMYVRPTDNWSEVNMMVFEMNNKIYYIASKTVPLNHELRVAYSPPYAYKYGLELISADSQRFTCEACGMVFRSKIARAGHSRNRKCRSVANEMRKVAQKRNNQNDNQPVENSANIKPRRRKQINPVAVPISRQRLGCSSCDAVFGEQELLDIHRLSHNNQTSQLEEDEEMPRTCPSCMTDFDDLEELLDHIIEEHSKRVRKPALDLDKYEGLGETLVIDMNGSSETVEEQDSGFNNQYELENMDHGYAPEKSKNLCKECGVVVESASALKAHRQSHVDRKVLFDCFICDEKFVTRKLVQAHVTSHCVDGSYHCPKCPSKVFESLKKCKKHIKNLHSGKELPCIHCDKVFSRPDKLRLHMVTHTQVKEFMCDFCGRQFARKDKLSEHIRKLHQMDGIPHNSKNRGDKSIKNKVISIDYSKYLFKCEQCNQGFKRRGMLVNHLTKNHPTVPKNSVLELNLPILKTQRVFDCIYCGRAYKSGAKRKLHIETKHPGQVVPPTKTKGLENVCTYSHAIGNIPSDPHSCEYCHKQYADKSKLTEHRKLKHPEHVVAATTRAVHGDKLIEHNINEHVLASESDVVALLQPLDGGGEQVTLALQPINLDTTRVDNSDILTQAMSVNELQPSLDFQTANHQLAANASVALQNAPLELRILPNSNIGIDLNSLQMADIANSGITFTVPNSALGLSQPLAQNALSTRHITPNLNSTASQNSPRPSWSYQIKLN